MSGKYLREISTVEQLLSPHAWIQQVHPDTVNLVDLNAFKCSAWCLDPSAIPTNKDLWVAEPPVAVVEDPPVKRLLAYPISIRSSTVFGPHGTAPSPPPSPPSSGDGSDEDASARRRRRLRSPLMRPNSIGRRPMVQRRWVRSAGQFMNGWAHVLRVQNT